MSKYFLIVIMLFGILLIGCEKEEDDKDTIVNNSSSQNTLKPTGTISGKVVDRHTENPVEGALISIAFNGSVFKTTTDESGSFSFHNVACNRDATTGTVTGTYQLTVSLVNVNKTIPDSLPKYREFYYNNTLNVTFIDLAYNDTSKNKIPVEGLEANIRFDVGKMNTTIVGQVVDEMYMPAVNATVYLEEAGTGDVLQTTTTNESGNYSFAKVEGGTTVFIRARSVNNALQGGLAGNLFLTINKNNFDLRSQVNVERIVVTPADNIAPYVTHIVPENLSDVSPVGLVMTIKFSEPIKQTAYTVTNVPLGLGTLIDDIHFDFIGFKKASGNTNFVLAWDSTYTTLTITPSQVTGASKYQLNVGTALGKLKDRAGNAVAANAIVGDFEPLNFTTNGNTSVPSSPVLTRRLSTGIGFSLLNFTGGTVGMEWSLDNNSRSYKVYRSVNNEPYKLLADNVLDTRFSDNAGFLVSGYNPPGDREPYVAFDVKYKVTGVSKDLVEGPASNVVTVKDDVWPQLANATVDSSLTGFDYVYLRFNEPLLISSAQTSSNYSISNLPASAASQITEAIYLGWNGTFYQVRLQITKQSIRTGEVVTISNQVRDMIGNPIDPNASSIVF
jgi:hypothetical protein